MGWGQNQLGFQYPSAEATTGAPETKKIPKGDAPVMLGEDFLRLSRGDCILIHAESYVVYQAGADGWAVKRPINDQSTFYYLRDLMANPGFEVRREQKAGGGWKHVAIGDERRKKNERYTRNTGKSWNPPAPY